MELALNLIWSLLALVMVCLWLRQAPRDASQRRAQMIALCVLLIILLPAISMTDDLMAAQNPAEVDSSLRRDHDYVRPHAIFPAAAAMLQLAFAGVSLDTHHQAVAPSLDSAPAFDPPALAPIQNRPPPAA
jgi:ABC-type uncharacterized transport system YnjBCD permease subunit